MTNIEIRESHASDLEQDQISLQGLQAGSTLLNIHHNQKLSDQVELRLQKHPLQTQKSQFNLITKIALAFMLFFTLAILRLLL